MKTLLVKIKSSLSVRKQELLIGMLVTNLVCDPCGLLVLY